MTQASAAIWKLAWLSTLALRPACSAQTKRCEFLVATAIPLNTIIERYYRDAMLMCIGEGTNEMQRIIIAKQLI